MTEGFNFRMNEVTAALGVVQIERLADIIAWKQRLAAKYDAIFERRVKFPDGMISGYYKYIVFDYKLKQETGKVFNHTDFGPEIEKLNEGLNMERLKAELPNSYWVSEHHACAPIWYGWEDAEKGVEELSSVLL
jgi:dTDP-4-amino-4,6-dideoxygalactose transaminase